MVPLNYSLHGNFFTFFVFHLTDIHICCSNLFSSSREKN